MYLSISGRTVGASRGLFAGLWQEYSRADARWAVADATVVSVEILTAVVAGPLAACAAYLVARNDVRRDFCIAILCTVELYGDFVRHSVRRSDAADDVRARVAHRQPSARHAQSGAPVGVPSTEQQVRVCVCETSLTASIWVRTRHVRNTDRRCLCPLVSWFTAAHNSYVPARGKRHCSDRYNSWAAEATAASSLVRCRRDNARWFARGRVR